MGRLQNLQSGVDAVLTEYARGYSNQNLVYRHFFPEVKVSKTQNRVPVFSKENLRTYNSRRALRSEGGVVSPDDIQYVRFETVSRRLIYPIDMEEYDNSDYDLDKRATRVVTDALELERELELSRIIRNNTLNLPTGTQYINAAGAWSNPATDVIGTIKDAMESFRRRTGVYPNRAIISPDALVALDKNEKIAERVKYTSRFTVSTDLLASLLTINGRQMLDIVVGSAIHNTVAGVWDEATETFVGEVNEDLHTKSFAMAYVSPNPSVFEPSFGYTFTQRGYPYIDRNLNKDTETVKIVRRDKTTLKVIGKDAIVIFHSVLN